MSRILIAEDEEALCAMCARALTMDGHEVKTAADGSEALDVLTREEGRFDLLLTDVRMPIMDGIALALNVARDFPKHDDPADDRLCRSARARPGPRRADP